MPRLHESVYIMRIGDYPIFLCTYITLTDLGYCFFTFKIYLLKKQLAAHNCSRSYLAQHFAARNSSRSYLAQNLAAHNCSRSYLAQHLAAHNYSRSYLAQHLAANNCSRSYLAQNHKTSDCIDPSVFQVLAEVQSNLRKDRSY